MCVQSSILPRHRVLRLPFVWLSYPSPNPLLLLVQTLFTHHLPEKPLRPPHRSLLPDLSLRCCYSHLLYISPFRNYTFYLFASLFSICFPNALCKHKVCCNKRLAWFIHCCRPAYPERFQAPNGQLITSGDKES